MVHVPYSGNFSHGANFRIFRMQASVCENKNFLPSPRPQTILVWGRDYSYTHSCVDEEVYVHMALYRYFRPVDALPGPSGPLSASVSPAAVKDT